MSRSNLLNRIRHINTVLVFIVCLGALALFAVIAWLMIEDAFPRREPPPVVQVHDEEAETPELRLGTIRRLPGWEVVKAPLRTPCEGGKLSVSGPCRTHNYLFFDLTASTSSWLLDSHRHVIAWETTVSVPVEGEKNCPNRAVALLVFVVSEDTNGDGELTARDGGVLATARPDGSGYRVLREGIHQVLDHQITEVGDAVVFFIADGTLQALRLNLETLRVLETTNISAAAGLGGE